MAHNAILMLSGIGFLMKRKIHCLLWSQLIVSCQSGEDFARPMAKLLLGGAGGVELRHCAFPNNGAEVIDFRTELGKHGRNKDIILADAERFGRFYDHVNMSRRLRMN